MTSFPPPIAFFDKKGLMVGQKSFDLGPPEQRSKNIDALIAFLISSHDFFVFGKCPS